MIVGGVFVTSTTLTVLVTETVTSFESFTVYVLVYVPTVAVFTVPVGTIADVRLPSSASKAVAPGSVNAFPFETVIGFEPSKVIVGGVFTGGVKCHHKSAYLCPEGRLLGIFTTTELPDVGVLL